MRKYIYQHCEEPTHDDCEWRKPDGESPDSNHSYIEHICLALAKKYDMVPFDELGGEERWITEEES